MSKKVYQKTTSNWLRPWNLEKFDNLYDRDERYFAVLLKGALSWLTDNIVLYNKPVNHYIYTTGSSCLYVESNGYTFSMNETSGEDYIYMKMPRCVLEIGDINIPTEELSAPFVRGQYERRDGNEIKGYNAQMRRLPIEISLSAKYVLSNFNESIILVQELIDKVSWQQYFNIIYLGQIIQCSLEIDNNYQIQLNKVDMTATDTNQKTIEIQFKLCSNYPSIDERTEVENSKIIGQIVTNTNIFQNGDITNSYDKETNIDLDSISTEGNLINLINNVNQYTIKHTEYNDKDSSVGNILAYTGNSLIKTKFDNIKNIQ